MPERVARLGRKKWGARSPSHHLCNHSRELALSRAPKRGTRLDCIFSALLSLFVNFQVPCSYLGRQGRPYDPRLPEHLVYLSDFNFFQALDLPVLAGEIQKNTGGTLAKF